MDVTELNDEENLLLRQTLGMGCKQRSIVPGLITSILLLPYSYYGISCICQEMNSGKLILLGVIGFVAIAVNRYQIATLPFVAHNARFDEGCLKAVFRVYQMDYPDYRFYDTLTASRRQFGQSLPNHQLQTVAAACGYDLQNHHHALADAEACAAIALYLL